MGETASGRVGEGTVARKTRRAEDIIALECLSAPVLSRSVRLELARVRNYRDQARPRTGFGISLGGATPHGAAQNRRGSG